MKNSSKIVFSALLLLTLPFISFADMVVWTEGDYETGTGKSYPSPISELSTYNDVTVSIYEGGGVGYFYMYDESEVTLYDSGSCVSYLYLYDNTKATFYNGVASMQIFIDPESTAEIWLYAYDVVNNIGPDGEGYLYGYWSANDNDLYSLYLHFTGYDESRVHIVPEPASALMLIVGASLMAFRRRKTTL